MHPLLVSRLEAIRASLLATYAGGQGMPDNFSGGEREVFVSEFLAKVFPAHYRFVGGAIIDSLGYQISGQIDVAVLLPTAPSFPLPAAGTQRLMLAENVAAVIEVKSNLSTQWTQVTSTTQKVHALKKHIRDTENPGEAEVTNIPVLAVGYRGWKDVGALKDHWEKTDEAVRPDAALMLENPAFVSASIHAQKEAALFAFVACLFGILEAHGTIKTDLMRYIVSVVPT